MSVVDSIKGALVPIHKEGHKFIAISAVITIVVGLLFSPLFYLGLVVTAWVAYFFRDPQRVTPVDASLVISPADGRISHVGEAVPPPELELGDKPRLRISVFMNVFNCHVNRVPVAGDLTKVAYKPGLFLNADLDKASEENERNGLVITNEHGAFGVVQVAGLVARRILCWAEQGSNISAGERFGLIRFGSRVDVYLPEGGEADVYLGQTVIAGETVLARFGANIPEREVRLD